ncbi:MAG: hypothetical protein ACKOVB_17405 [Terrabacter sp.]
MPLRERSHTGKALAVIALGVAFAVMVTLGALHVLEPSSGHPISSPAGTPAPTRIPAGPARPATMPSETVVTEMAEPGFGGADAQQEEFYQWAAGHQVGSLNLPGMDAGTGQLAAVANGYCDLLSDQPGGSGDEVARTIRMQTGTTKSMSQELLERSVAAFCPQKARFLV